MTERQLDEDERRQEPERQVQRGSPPLEAALPCHAEHPARQGGHGQDLRDGERPPVIRAGGERSPDEHRLEAGDGAEVEPPFAREIGRRHRPSGRRGPGHHARGFADPAVGPSRMLKKPQDAQQGPAARRRPTAVREAWLSDSLALARISGFARLASGSPSVSVRPRDAVPPLMGLFPILLLHDGTVDWGGGKLPIFTPIVDGGAEAAPWIGGERREPGSTSRD